MNFDLSKITSAGAAVVISFFALIAGLIVYVIRKNYVIKTKLFSMEKKAAVVSEDRGLLNNQIRNAENYTGSIERMIGNAFLRQFPDLTDGQKSECMLLANIVRRALDKQVMLDLLTNHILEKPLTELELYIKSKSDGHISRIYNFVHNYNDTVLPDNDLSKAVDCVDKEKLFDCFSRIYKGAVMCAGKSAE